MSIADRISRGLKASLGGRAVDAVANGLLIVVLTRVVLTPEGYGLLHYALSIIGVVTILATLGLPSSAARYVTEFGETDAAQLRHVIRFSLLAIVGLALLIGGTLAVFSVPLAGYFREPALAPLLVLGLGYVLFQALMKFLNKLFQAVNHVEWSATLTAVSGAVRLVAATGLAMIGFGAVGAMAGYVLGFVVATALGAAVFYRKFYSGYPDASSVKDGLRRRILEYSVPLTATRGANVLDKRVDTILVGMFLGATPVSFYTIAKQVVEFGSIPASSLGYTISPTVGEQKAADHMERARRVYEESLRHVLLLYVPGLVGLVLVAGPVIRYVFGPEYLGAEPVLQVLAGFLLVNAVNKVTSDGLDYLGRARERAIVKTATAVANFLLNLVLIPTIGVVGAAIATVVTYTIYTGANVYIMHLELSLHLYRLGRLLAAAFGIAAAMAIIVVLLLPYVGGVPSLLGVVTVGVVVWAMLAVAGGLLDPRSVRAFF